MPRKAYSLKSGALVEDPTEIGRLFGVDVRTLAADLGVSHHTLLVAATYERSQKPYFTLVAVGRRSPVLGPVPPSPRVFIEAADPGTDDPPSHFPLMVDEAGVRHRVGGYIALYRWRVEWGNPCYVEAERHPVRGRHQDVLPRRPAESEPDAQPLAPHISESDLARPFPHALDGLPIVRRFETGAYEPSAEDWAHAREAWGLLTAPLPAIRLGRRRGTTSISIEEFPDKERQVRTELILESGDPDPSDVDIAARLGISEATLYRYRRNPTY